MIRELMLIPTNFMTPAPEIKHPGEEYARWKAPKAKTPDTAEAQEAATDRMLAEEKERLGEYQGARREPAGMFELVSAAAAGKVKEE